MPVAEEPVDIDPVMAAMIAAGDMPMPEGAVMPEMPADISAAEEAPAAETIPEPTEELQIEEAIPEPTEELQMEEMPLEAAEETPAENLDAILNAEVDALTEPDVAEALTEPETVAEALTEPETVAEALTEPISEAETQTEADAEIPMADPSLDMAITEEMPAVEETMEQIPVELDMSSTDVLSGAAEEIENFLDGEDYEYIKVDTADKTLIIIKTQSGNSMAVTYAGGEFEALESGYDKDGKTGYNEIMNDFVKETIKSGGHSQIRRHKGSKVVAE